MLSFFRAGGGGGGVGPGSLGSALARATPNSTQPLNPQEVLYLMGAAAREPPAMAAAWAERMMSLGREAEASLKMLTLLHKLQLHSPQFIATLLGSSFHGHSFADVLKELWTRLRQMPSSKRGPFICAYLVYLQLRLSSPAYATEHRQTPVAGRTAQRRLELAQLAAQIPTLETLFDRALDVVDAGTLGLLTQEPLLLLLSDASTAFVQLSDALANTLDTHWSLDVFGVSALVPVWAAFPARAERLIDAQKRLSQPLSAYASAIHSKIASPGAVGGASPTCAAVPPSSILLWPSATAARQQSTATEAAALRSQLRAASKCSRLLLQWLISRLSPEQMEVASGAGLIRAAMSADSPLPDEESLLAMLDALPTATSVDAVAAASAQAKEGPEDAAVAAVAAAAASAVLAAGLRTPSPPPRNEQFGYSGSSGGPSGGADGEVGGRGEGSDGAAAEVRLGVAAEDGGADGGGDDGAAAEALAAAAELEYLRRENERLREREASLERALEQERAPTSSIFDKLRARKSAHPSDADEAGGVVHRRTHSEGAPREGTAAQESSSSVAPEPPPPPPPLSPCEALLRTLPATPPPIAACHDGRYLFLYAAEGSGCQLELSDDHVRVGAFEALLVAAHFSAEGRDALAALAAAIGPALGIGHAFGKQVAKWIGVRDAAERSAGRAAEGAESAGGGATDSAQWRLGRLLAAHAEGDGEVAEEWVVEAEGAATPTSNDAAPAAEAEADDDTLSEFVSRQSALVLASMLACETSRESRAEPPPDLACVSAARRVLWRLAELPRVAAEELPPLEELFRARLGNLPAEFVDEHGWAPPIGTLLYEALLDAATGATAGEATDAAAAVDAAVTAGALPALRAALRVRDAEHTLCVAAVCWRHFGALHPLEPDPSPVLKPIVGSTPERRRAALSAAMSAARTALVPAPAAPAASTRHVALLRRRVHEGCAALLSDYRRNFAPAELGLESMKQVVELLVETLEPPPCFPPPSGVLGEEESTQLVSERAEARADEAAAALSKKQADMCRSLVAQAMRAHFSRFSAANPQAEVTAPEWLAGLLRGIGEEVASERAYSVALRPWLRAPTAEAGAAMWRCVQPLLQATLLSLARLDDGALTMLYALRDVRRQLDAIGVTVQMGLQPLFATWMASFTASWDASAASALEDDAPIDALLAPLRSGRAMMFKAADTCDAPDLVAAMVQAVPAGLGTALGAFARALVLRAEASARAARAPRAGAADTGAYAAALPDNPLARPLGPEGAASRVELSRCLVWSENGQRWDLSDAPPSAGALLGDGTGDSAVCAACAALVMLNEAEQSVLWLAREESDQDAEAPAAEPEAGVADSAPRSPTSTGPRRLSEDAAAATVGLTANVDEWRRRLVALVGTSVVLNSAAGDALRELPEVGPMEAVGDALMELRPLVAVVTGALGDSSRSWDSAIRAVTAALLLRFTELALHMSDHYDAHAPGAASRPEMLRRLLSNFDDLRRFIREQQPKASLPSDGEEIAGGLIEAIKLRWCPELAGAGVAAPSAASPGAAPFRTRADAGKAQGKASKLAGSLSGKLRGWQEELRESSERTSEKFKQWRQQ